MTEQATGESSDITLQERVKLLKVVVDKRRYKAGSDIQWSSKKWTKRITILRSSSFPTNPCLEHFSKDAKLPLYNGVIESMDDTIVGIKYVARAKKRNAVEIMFDYHSLLMSFELETTMRRWVEELRRIANYYPMLLTTTINDTMKQGDYVLVPEPEQVLVYDAHTKVLAWKWDLTQIQKFQHRRMASEVEITVGSGSSTGAGSCVFFGQRLERFCDSLTEYARSLALKPLGKYSTSKSSTTLASDASSHTHTISGEGNLLKPSQDASIEKRASYTDGQVSSAGTGFRFDGDRIGHPMEKEFTRLHISSSQQKSNDRDALLCDTD